MILETLAHFQFLDGVLQIANIFLSLVAGIIAITLFKVSHTTRHLRPWKLLLVALFLFVIQQILGALVAFEIIAPTFFTHLIPTIILFSLIFALDVQIREHTTKRKSK